MKKKRYTSGIITLCFLLLTVSCEDYLDKAPDSIITEKDAFGNFISFQGFVEEMYNCITDYNKAGAWNQYLFADETLNNYPYSFDLGDYWDQQKLFNNENPANTGDESRRKRIWPLCWYGIRKANMALEYLPLMIDASQEERDLIKGQALFFRGWFYFELMRYWGGMPYINYFLSPSEDLYIPRQNYRETALKAADDFREAAELLPIDWDAIEAGARTLGNNQQRISKIHALGYLGKNLLYAASPMMNEESTGNNNYDTDLCKQAAEAFAEALKICDETGVYQLQPWESWTDIFWVWSPKNELLPGGKEVIMSPTVYNPVRVRTSTAKGTVPTEIVWGGSKEVEVPTHNYLKNYAMANGMPIHDPESGYDPNDPWTNREPRFYVDIIIDGDKMVNSSAAGADRFAQLYTGGRHRSTSVGSVTGYYYKRYTPIGCNQWDNKHLNFQAYIPYLRLADIYLMYAESVLHGYGSPGSSPPQYQLSAVGAVNMIRNRAQLPDLAPKYTANNEVFMEEIIRERAVELAFEGDRFNDLRRWNLNMDLKYREKTAIDFDRGPNGKPINLRERVVVTRVVEKKHNWLPIQIEYTNLYPEFPQNPGW